MSLTVYNTLSRTKEAFTPIVPGRVHMYVCGPTVYDHAHLGHAKTYVNFDMIVRYLRYSGIKVRYVQNITDVGHILDTGEDRILKGARPRAHRADGSGRALRRAATSRTWPRWACCRRTSRRAPRPTSPSRSR